MSETEDAVTLMTEECMEHHPSVLPIVQRFGWLMVHLIPLIVYYQVGDPVPSFLMASDVAPEKEILIRRALGIYPGGSNVTVRELAIRMWALIDNIIPDYLEISTIHDITAIFFIVSGMDQSWEWPPMFGSILHVYSVRFYWAKFWHLIIYKSFSAHSASIIWWVGIREKTVVTRFTRNALVFILSAVMHGLVDWRMQPRCTFSRSLLYWFMQPMAFVMEGLVQHYWKQWTGDSTQSPSKIRTVFERLVGYMWAFVWMYWCVPKRVYPLLTCGKVV